ncbi:hypothetical protein FAVG1_12948 [Fusarium avenaceum]|nr:hypothetical protein FAVG1_12948 [Fusarium avenaceum]
MNSRGLHTFSSHNNTGYWPSLGRHPSGIDFSYQGWEPNPNVNMPRPVPTMLNPTAEFFAPQPSSTVVPRQTIPEPETVVEPSNHRDTLRLHINL